MGFNDCDGRRWHILGVHETVCDVVLHMRFLMTNGGHYTAFFLYLTLFNSDNKDFGQGQQTFPHAEHYQALFGYQKHLITYIPPIFSHLFVIVMLYLSRCYSTNIFYTPLKEA
jgi:hypothetical protein